MLGKSYRAKTSFKKKLTDNLEGRVLQRIGNDYNNDDD